MVSELPPTRRVAVSEILHGASVADPYRWLEDDAADEVRQWTAAQNARTEAILGAAPGRAAIEARLGALLRVGAVFSPAVHGERYFYMKREGTWNQPILLARDGLHGDERAVVDPNRLDQHGQVALDWWYPSPDGSLVAFGTSRDGDEWSTLRVVEVDSGQLRPDAIPRTRYCSLAWLPDNSGFYYTRYPEPGTVEPGQEEYNAHAFFHHLGTDPVSDPKVFGAGRPPEEFLALAVSRDGRWLIAAASEGWTRNDLYLCDLAHGDGAWTPLVEGEDALFTGATPTSDRLYLLTNAGAPNWRIVAIDLTRPIGSVDTWTTLVPERADRVIEGFALAADRIVTHEMEAATSRLRRYDRAGAPLGDLPLPGLGTVIGLDADETGTVAVVGFTSFAVPAHLLAFNLTSGWSESFSAVPAPDGAAVPISVEQVRYPSRDGTPISMFLVHRAGLTRTGDHPTVLTGYGGFGLNESPTFDSALPLWLEHGGVLAVANLRGGGEYGEAWHRAGMLANKQNVFDDVLAAAEWLITAGYTNADRLAIAGGSNGGLLVGAAITQRPDLFRAAYCAVPLLDMIRYHLFRIARLWIPEYGAADDPEQFGWLAAYSPYHRAREGVCYPATLLTCGEVDSRVDPLHARKMAALLQHATICGSERPILLRAESQAGHGQGKPLTKRVAEEADKWSFLGWQLGVAWDNGGAGGEARRAVAPAG